MTKHRVVSKWAGKTLAVILGAMTTSALMGSALGHAPEAAASWVSFSSFGLGDAEAAKKESGGHKAKQDAEAAKEEADADKAKADAEAALKKFRDDRNAKAEADQDTANAKFDADQKAKADRENPVAEGDPLELAKRYRLEAENEDIRARERVEKAERIADQNLIGDFSESNPAGELKAARGANIAANKALEFASQQAKRVEDHRNAGKPDSTLQPIRRPSGGKLS